MLWKRDMQADSWIFWKLHFCFSIATTEWNTLYAYVVLLFLAKMYAILPKGIALEVLLNRFF